MAAFYARIRVVITSIIILSITYGFIAWLNNDSYKQLHYQTVNKYGSEEAKAIDLDHRNSTNDDVMTPETLMYTPPWQSGLSKQGIPISVSQSVLESFHLDQTEFRVLTADNVGDFVIVTGASANHFRESQDAVAGMQEYFPHRSVYYYDLGLKKEQREQILSWCNVVLRDLPWSSFPPHVKKMHTYAFKPLIMREMLQKHGGALWIDASFRMKNSNWTDVYARILQSGGGAYGFHNGQIPLYATTHPNLYAYLPPSDDAKLKDNHTMGTGALLLHNTRNMHTWVLRWWYLCALDKQCIAPTAQLHCDMSLTCEGSYPCWVGCHRFDQSVINILLKNFYQHDPNYPICYLVNPIPENPYISIIRKPSAIFKLKTC